jgi:hypothetical protein
MKKSLTFISFSLFLILIQISCTKDNNTVVICGNRCPSDAPWKVETLDIGLPCFSRYDSCRKWATAHGYADKPCVRCD